MKNDNVMKNHYVLKRLLGEGEHTQIALTTTMSSELTNIHQASTRVYPISGGSSVDERLSETISALVICQQVLVFSQPN